MQLRISVALVALVARAAFSMRVSTKGAKPPRQSTSRPASAKAKEKLLHALALDELDDLYGDSWRPPRGHSQKSATAGDATLDSTSLLQKAKTQQYCHYWSSTTMRWYYFQVMQYAAVLIRSPKAPRMIFYPNQTWDVRDTGDPEIPLDWTLRAVPGQEVDPPLEIDFAYEVQSVRRLLGEEDGEPNGLEINFKNGTSFSFTGGAYFPGDLVYEASRSAREADMSTDPDSLDLHNNVHAAAVHTFTDEVETAAGGTAKTFGFMAGMAAFTWTSGAVFLLVSKILSDAITKEGWEKALDNLNWALIQIGSDTEASTHSMPSMLADGVVLFVVVLCFLDLVFTFLEPFLVQI
eukprot:TRINITY_DN30158_c1_g3_i2.p1 TRINITY_DN30158_c1_g3~~TRINITY_DN30158_c1_g3_i2.p1  ORF type:complete len:350 (-),score=62.82 TRINITY_DN30158_c1_g3_i2:538-1587(-)